MFKCHKCDSDKFICLTEYPDDLGSYEPSVAVIEKVARIVKYEEESYTCHPLHANDFTHQIACEECGAIYFFCPDCMCPCRIIGHCGYRELDGVETRWNRSKDGEMTLMWTFEFHRQEDAVDDDDDFDDGDAPFYLGDLDMYYLDIEHPLKGLVITGPDGGFPVFVECPRCQGKYCLSDK